MFFYSDYCIIKTKISAFTKIGGVSNVNFHADNVKTGKAIVNYHIVKYSSGNSDCLYVYDSVSKKVIINQCFGDWTDAAAAVVEAVKSAVQAVLLIRSRLAGNSCYLGSSSRCCC